MILFALLKISRMLCLSLNSSTLSIPTVTLLSRNRMTVNFVVLDIFDANSSRDFVFFIFFFHKKTYTGFLTIFVSFTPFRYKVGLIRLSMTKLLKSTTLFPVFLKLRFDQAFRHSQM